MATGVESLSELVDRVKQFMGQTSVNLYDLLPPEDREAIEWVRGEGGLPFVKAACNSYVDTFESYTVLRDEVAKRAGGDLLQTLQKSDNGIMDMLDRRLMPEGMEWPRFKDGEPVRPGDKLLDKDGDWFKAVSFVFTFDWWSIRGYQVEGFGDLNGKTRRTLEGMSYGARVKRPDSWARLEEDAGKQPYVYCVEHGLDDDSFPTNEKFARDLVRRAKALAGVGE